MLHTATGGNVVGRSMFGMLVGADLLSLYGAIVFFSTRSLLSPGRSSSVFTAQWLFPISCWLKSVTPPSSVSQLHRYAYSAEGWEAELKIRTEAYKLEKRQQLVSW